LTHQVAIPEDVSPAVKKAMERFNAKLRECEAPKRFKTYLHFELLFLKGRRTKYWRITSVQTGVYLGLVEWRPSWRKYCFYPQADTVFDEKCLAEITDHLRRAMAEHCVDLEKAKRARF
jgi:hypothetical protein